MKPAAPSEVKIMVLLTTGKTVVRLAPSMEQAQRLAVEMGRHGVFDTRVADCIVYFPPHQIDHIKLTT